MADILYTLLKNEIANLQKNKQEIEHLLKKLKTAWV
jgi:hypothetical protein